MKLSVGEYIRTSNIAVAISMTQKGQYLPM